MTNAQREVKSVGRLGFAESLQSFVAVDADVSAEEARLGALFNMMMIFSVFMMLSLSIGFLTAMQLGYFVNEIDGWIGFFFPFGFIPISVACFYRAKRGHVRSTIWFYIVSMFVAVCAAALVFGGVGSAAWILMVWPVSLAGTLIAPRYALYFTGAALLAFALLLAMQTLGIYTAPLVTTLENFRFLGLWFIFLMLILTGGGLTYLNGTSLRQALDNLRTTSQELGEARDELEQRVHDRTEELELRAEQFRAIAELSQTTGSLDDPQELLNLSVRLIAQGLDFYHVGIFMLDPSREWAVLRAASSEGGQRMLDRGHRLRVGRQGVVGYVAEMGISRFAFNVGEDAAWFNNPDLPETKSEIALPLLASGRVVGVLDIQTQQPAAFDERDREVFQILADNIAVALQKTRLLDEARSALQRLERYQDENVIRAWRQSLARRDMRVGYAYTSGETQKVDAAEMSEGSDATPGRTAGIDGGVVRETTDNGRHRLLAPIRVGGQPLGFLAFERVAPWSDETVQLVESVTAQLDLALNNARLLEETQLRATQEAARSEIVSRVRALTSTDAILRSAAEELGRALQVERSRIQLVKFD
jgi:GAF domain-containing protein